MSNVNKEQYANRNEYGFTVYKSADGRYLLGS